MASKKKQVVVAHKQYPEISAVEIDKQLTLENWIIRMWELTRFEIETILFREDGTLSVEFHLLSDEEKEVIKDVYRSKGGKI